MKHVEKICRNCKGEHFFNDKNCPTREKEMKIIDIMSEESITYREAIEKLKTKNQFFQLSNTNDYPHLGQQYKSFSTIMKQNTNLSKQTQEKPQTEIKIKKRKIDRKQDLIIAEVLNKNALDGPSYKIDNRNGNFKRQTQAEATDNKISNTVKQNIEKMDDESEIISDNEEKIVDQPAAQYGRKKHQNITTKYT